VKARVASVNSIATDIIWVELEPLSGIFPLYTPGSHVDFIIPGVGVRQYSLTGDGKAYSFAIQKEPVGRGGSVYLHNHLKVGSELEISAPRNNFPLHADKPLLFLAGGIGITPFLSMLQSVKLNGSRFLYFSRSNDRLVMTPALGNMSTDGTASILINKTPDETADAIQMALDTFSNEVRVYCCGPSPFIDAARRICDGRDGLTFHSESFAPQGLGQVKGDSDFYVVLAKSNRRICVPSGISLLEALRSEGVFVDSSCESGLCGTCRIPYEGGLVEHRDLILTNEERKTFLLACCSRSQSEELILSI